MAMVLCVTFSAVLCAGAAGTVLKKDSKGDDVLAMQTRLKELGYYSGSLTGSFGSLTEDAVIKFQKANDLTADGIAGEKTLALLNGQETNTSSSSSTSSSSVLKEGVKGSEDVKSLQTSLKSLGYYSGSVTGNYGSLTAEAVRKYQKANGLTADGIAGTKTLAALSGSSTSSSFSGSASSGSVSTSTALKPGTKGSSDVKSLQTTLKSLGYYNGSITGNYGDLTTEAVRKYQKANGLTADGIAGAKTLAALSGSGSSATASTSNAPKAGSVQNVNWYTMRKQYSTGTEVTVYDFETGLSWKCKFTTVDKHADGEPLTSQDTDTMYVAFGKKNTWEPKAVWYTMPDGKTYIGSIHNMPHGTDKISGNNFKGILCMHFPRVMSEAEATGSYAVKHQKAILAGWEKTQKMQ